MTLLPLATLAGDAVGSRAAEIPRALIAKGVTRVGDFDLEKFVRDSDRIEWRRFDPKNPPPRLTEGRRSAYYLTDRHKVYVSEAVPAKSAQRPVLELHEALGALGYNDKHYSVSTSLEMLRETKDPKSRDTLSKELGKSIFDGKNLSSEGSGSSVGGGGDLVALEVKQAVMRELLKAKPRVSITLLEAFALISFEPLYNPDEQFVAVKYNVLDLDSRVVPVPLAAVPIKNNRQELISVYVPVLAWNQSPRLRRQIVREAADIVHQTFPVKAGRDTVEYRIPGCRGEVHFPRPRYFDAATVQNFRAEFLLGCGSMAGMMEMRIPSFRDYRGKTSDAPLLTEQTWKESRFYVCTLALVGGDVIDTFYFRADRRSGKSRALHSWTVGDRHHLSAVVSYDAAAVTDVTMRETKLEGDEPRPLPIENEPAKKPTERVFKTTFGERGVVSCRIDENP